jgi:hypothetical protein
MRRTSFVILDDDGDFVALHPDNGGYPSKATGIGTVKYWHDFDEAAKYVAVMNWNKPNHNWTIVEVELITRHIPRNLQVREVEVWNERNGDGKYGKRERYTLTGEKIA